MTGGEQGDEDHHMSWSVWLLAPTMTCVGDNELRVYPNPLEDIFYLDAAALLGTQPEEWEACIYDTQGREMDCLSPRAQFHVSMNSIELPSGSYLLKLRHQSGTRLTAKVFVR